MTIDEAIKVLEEERSNHHSFSTDIIGQAEQLGIEALKRIQVGRARGVITQKYLLPGETEY